jgi:hypothetical protein
MRLKRRKEKYVRAVTEKVEDFSNGFDRVPDYARRSGDSYEDLRAYPDAEEVKQSLRHIPNDLAEALQVVPELFLDATCKLHGRMSHWSTRLAYAKSKYTAAKLAKEVGLERIKDSVRLASGKKSITETLVTSKAKASDDYADLCLCYAEAEKEYLRVSALVEAISTKKAALRILSFYTKPEMDSANMAYVHGLGD